MILKLREEPVVLSSQGATIKRHEMTGDLLVARVIRGGLAERSGRPTPQGTRGTGKLGNAR